MSDVVRMVTAFPWSWPDRSEADVEDELCRLMGEYERFLLPFAGTLLRDGDLAQDCVQDTFLRAYQSLCRGRQVNQHWLFKVTYNRAMDELRRWRVLRLAPDDFVAPSSDGSSETSLIVRQTLERLPQQYREVLYLFVVAGFKTEEIAALLETTGPAVRQRLHRARQEFRRVYGELATEPRCHDRERRDEACRIVTEHR